MGREIHELELLLSLNDQWSKGLTSAEKLLRKLEGRETRRQRDAEGASVRAGREGEAAARRRATHAEQGLRYERDRARLVVENARAEREQTRLAREQTRLATDRLRHRREESRLTQSDERARRAPLPPAPRRSHPRPGAWMRDSDAPPRWRDEVDDRKGPGARRERSRSTLDRMERAGRHIGRARDVAYDFRDAYGQAHEGIRQYTDPAGDLARARMRLGTLGLNPDEATRADDAIKKAVAAVPGARLSEVTQAFAELYEVFASVDDTARSIQRAAQYSFAMKTIHGDLYSPEQLITQTKAAYKFVDLVGLTKPDARGQVNHARVDEYHDRLMQVLSATGGEVNPREMLQAAKIGGTSLMGMSREGLTHLASLASDVTGSRAGNMQRSMLQSFVGGKLFDKHVNALAEYGMVDPSKVRKGKGGKLDIQPGGIRYADTISTDPLIFIDKLAEGMRGKGVDTNVEKDVINATARLTPNTLAQNMIAQMIIRREEVTRFDELVKKAEALDRMLGRAEGSPLGKMEDARAKAENARATLGGPMLEAGGSLSEHISSFYTGLQSFAEGSPVMSSALAGIGSLGGAALSAGEGVGTLAGLLNELRGGGPGGGRGGGGGGGWFGTGADTSDALGTGYVGWRALKGGGRAAAGLLGAMWGPAAIAALGGGSIYALHEQHTFETQKRREAEGNAASQYEAAKRLREQSGGRLTEDAAREIAAKAFPGVDRRGLLTALDVREPSASAGYPGMAARPSFNHDEVMAGAFARLGPELKFPEVMAAFLKDLRGKVQRGEVTKEGAAQIERVAKTSLPDSFRAASEALETEMKGQTDAARAVSESTERAAESMKRVQGELDRFGFSLGSFAERVNSIELNAPPQPSTPGEGGARPPSRRNIFDYDPLNPFEQTSFVSPGGGRSSKPMALDADEPTRRRQSLSLANIAALTFARSVANLELKPPTSAPSPSGAAPSSGGDYFQGNPFFDPFRQTSFQPPVTPRGKMMALAAEGRADLLEGERAGLATDKAFAPGGGVSADAAGRIVEAIRGLQGIRGGDRTVNINGAGIDDPRELARMVAYELAIEEERG